MRRQFAVIVLMSVMLIQTLAGAMPVPPDVKKVVAFIFAVGPDGKVKPRGTGFFTSVKIKQDPTQSAGYFVTAKHVLRTDDGKSWLPSIFVRMNKRGGGSELLRLDIVVDGPGKNVFTHGDPSVDIALIPSVPDQKKYDYKFLPEEFLTTKEDYKTLNISEGSEVFFTGLFLPHVAEQNYPIVRFGRVALVSEEGIDINGVKTDLYLMEANAYGGNSGSPVFFYLGAERTPGSITVGAPILKLAGVVSGHFNDVVPVQLAQTDSVPVVTPNNGIAAVVPAFKLQEILFGLELSNIRSSMKTATKE